MAHTIEIRVIGNPGLYRDLQASFAAESTRHRSISGAARRLAQLRRKSDDWAATTGRWGTVEVIVDGREIDGFWSQIDIWDYSRRDPQSVIEDVLALRIRESLEEAMS